MEETNKNTINFLVGVEVIRSARRRKTMSARMINNVMRVYVPKDISHESLNRIIHVFKERFNRKSFKKKLNEDKPLEEIAKAINAKYFQGKLEITSIEYVVDQTRKFGCCNYRDKTIRISHRIAQMPDWVRDYVIMHEMAHLVEPNHGHNFWDIVSHYELSERAKGYLMAKGIEVEE